MRSMPATTPRVVELLGNVEPEKASLEQMFLLAFSYDASGLNQPTQARAWYERIISRYPDSPWAKAATDCSRPMSRTE